MGMLVGNQTECLEGYFVFKQHKSTKGFYKDFSRLVIERLVYSLVISCCNLLPTFYVVKVRWKIYDIVNKSQDSRHILTNLIITLKFFIF